MISAGLCIGARGMLQVERQGLVVERREVGENELCECPEHAADGVESLPGFIKLELEPLMHVLVEMFEQLLSRVCHPAADGFLHFLLQLSEGRLNLLNTAAGLIDGEDPFFKIYTGLDSAKHIIAGAKDA